MTNKNRESNTKKYNGEIFYRHGSGVWLKNQAEAEKKKLKKQGYNVRIQYRKRQKAYLVWKRMGKKKMLKTLEKSKQY
jgi:hypothetical protein